jgi:undecaprenyl-diphosphatase
MSVLYAILLGILQGITEFLPVSSFGHVSIVENALGITQDSGALFETLLHVGTLAAVFFMFQKDIRRIFEELVGMSMDLVGNLNLYVHNRRTGEELRYARIVTGTYRKFTALVIVSTIPTALLGFAARHLVVLAEESSLFPGIGLLITGVFLLVVDFSRCGGSKTPKEAGYDHAMWIGICQGLSVFPGISRCGFTTGMGLFCGFSRKFAVKYSFLMSIPAIIGALLVEFPNFWTSGISAGTGFTYIVGMLAAGISGYFMIRLFLKITQTAKFRYFAVYCFLAAIVGLAWNLA